MKPYLIFIVCFFAAGQAFAQRYFGIATSNWSGTNSLYLNPAYIADDRYKFSIDLASVNVGVDNDLGTINAGNVSKQFIGGTNVGLLKMININNSGNFNMMAPNAEVRLPGFMFSINHKNSIAITMRVRAMNQFSNFDQTLFSVLGGSNGSLLSKDNTLVNLNNFKWMLNAWSQISATYAKVLLEVPKHQLKAGLTISYLGGIAYAGFKGNQLTATYHVYSHNLSVDSTTVDVNSSDVSYASNIIKNTDQLQSGINTADVANYFFGKKAGYGIGADVGLVYEYRPGFPENYEYEMDGKQHLDLTKNMYKLRLAVSVTDIGSINYDQNNLQASLTGSGHISSNDGNTNFNNFSDVRNYASSHGFTVDTSQHGATRVYLPTALVASVDYHVISRFYLNATYLADLTNHNNFGNNYYNQATVTPRYDSKGISIGVPLTYSTLNNKIKAGLGMRYGGFFVGSDDMLALFNNNQYGFNAYFGAFVPINKKKIKDRDNDRVSDKYDRCPTIPGDLSAHGCPDRDHDGVPDMEDRCPDDSGAVELQGCPDRDDDGVPDIDDKCPDIPGLEQYNGCPDTDHDGVPDNEDNCPTIPGPISNHGCPIVVDTPKPVKPVEAPKKEEIKQEVKDKVSYAAKSVEFETGKAILKKSSFAALDAIVKILNENPNAYMTIDGYTDNVGQPENNMKLSGNRADAVKEYFEKHGIKSGRLISTGHGDTNPIAPNTTAEGRAKNRRVVMELKIS
jgi:outer membrane protein OmpA-like peptidoglycan-associated protein